MFNKVGDFLQSRSENNESRAERRENARKAYKLAKKMRKELEKDPELAKAVREGNKELKQPIK
jgi:hypothetical protein|tara:strand:- start:626 stop:814 length:189 start_codon:yes stop_codon:yes gene_type:complete